jgi:hypothetical protein
VRRSNDSASALRAGLDQTNSTNVTRASTIAERARMIHAMRSRLEIVLGT